MDNHSVWFEYENSWENRGKIYVDGELLTSFSKDKKQGIFLCSVRGDFPDTRVPGLKFIRAKMPDGLVVKIRDYLKKGKIDIEKTQQH